MKGEIDFDFDNVEVKKSEIKTLSKNVLPLISKIEERQFLSKDDSLNTLNLVFDIHKLEEIEEVARQKRALHPKIIVIVGIGGSNLGTMAVERAVLDEYESRKIGAPKVLYADTIDTNLLNSITKDVEINLAKGENILVIAISKSGTTLESITNFEILINSVKKYKEDYKKYLFTISDANSPLTKWAKDNSVSFLTIPEYVGGRYSVFSSVSLFPLALIGVNVSELLAGARKMHHLCLQKDYRKNPALISAISNFYHYKKGVDVSNTFLFGKNLYFMGIWYRQLLAESLGKEKNLKNKKVNFGQTPIVSQGTEDLHSMQQLFMEGPKNKFTTFVSYIQHEHSINVPLILETKLASFIEGMPISKLNAEVLEGVKKSFSKKRLPFIDVKLQNTKEFCIGQFLMWKMFEVVYIANLANINPFDQPGVESYKKETKESLSKN